VLAEAHRSGIIHRDIKPSNIFLHQTREGEVVKVVDFGIAKLIGDEEETGIQSLTATGSMVGTPNYMAPERFGNKPYDGKSDVYSLGVMLYQMLCGRLPFESSKEGYIPVAIMHLTKIPPSPRQINPDIPEEFDLIVMKALAKEPELRPTADRLKDLILDVVKDDEEWKARQIRVVSQGGGDYLWQEYCGPYAGYRVGSRWGAGNGICGNDHIRER
jgi:serine/threonine protein kinase